jgi:hypothetical protein
MCPSWPIFFYVVCNLVFFGRTFHEWKVKKPDETLNWNKAHKKTPKTHWRVASQFKQQIYSFHFFVGHQSTKQKIK